uniref:NS1 protein n=1 Tax=Rhinolophus bat parvovirus TaxID=3038986 RepID=A0AAU7E1Y2_9VIRU
MFPCQICDRMNQSVDVCFTHGTKSCEICFPRGSPDGQVGCFEMGEEEAEKEMAQMCDNRCNTCKMRNIYRPGCVLCAEIALECLDDLNKEQ